MSAIDGADDPSKMPCYIARKRCGCIVMALVDSPGRERGVAKEVGKCIRQGLAVERVDVDYVRKNMNKCEHKADKNA